ncbi:MAG: hypothetical protein VW625_03595 [Perlucidibaca sp.]
MTQAARAGLAGRLFWPVALITAALMVWGIWRPYSFWVDEIFSVVAAGETPPDMFAHWILIDVHPPLYQLLLNAWVHAFGSSELAARSLSLLPGLAVVALAILLRRRRPELSGFCLFLLAMPWLVYNAQETRSYIYLYLLALTALYGLMSARRSLFLASLVLMSWLHYFGLFLALSLLFVQVVSAWRIRRGDLLAGLLMLTWLPLHLTFGNLLHNASGGFWIQVAGPGETLANLFSALSPACQLAWRVSHQIAWAYALVLLLWLGYFPWRHWRGHAVDRLDLQLSWSLLLFIGGIMVIDQFVPMSTQRNFLIAMPLMAWLLWRIARERLAGWRWSAFLLLWLVAQLGTAAALMQHKQSAVENYRGATQAVLALTAMGERGWYLDTCEIDRVYNSDAINNFYVDQLGGAGVHLRRLCTHDLPALPPGQVVLACHQMSFEALRALMPAGYAAHAMDAKGLCAVLAPAGVTLPPAR